MLVRSKADLLQPSTIHKGYGTAGVEAQFILGNLSSPHSVVVAAEGMTRADFLGGISCGLDYFLGSFDNDHRRLHTHGHSPRNNKHKCWIICKV